MQQLLLKPREDRRLRRGHLWVFSNEVARAPESAQAGELVEVITSGGTSLGSAFFHPHSLISARLLGSRIEEADGGFFQGRIAAAARLREQLYGPDDCCRLVHGESDLLPGLIIDRYGSSLVLQTLCAAMDRLQPLILEVLRDLFEPDVVVERNDMSLRALESLPQRKGVLWGDWFGARPFNEAGIAYEVDLLEGQKTGLFLDQKTNRQAVARYCRGAKVLDCFCNAGGFSLHAARAGAARVTGVDVSRPVVAAATRNVRLNALDSNLEFLEADVFDFLESVVRARERYDVVILDPPSFAPRKKDVPRARQAYRRLNRLAMRALNHGGILASASCSFHVREEVFHQLVADAAVREGRRLQLLERRGQAPDHPILPGMPETAYLKLGIYRVL